MDTNIFSLPISLGEAIDKLTILDIKLDKIKDIRRIDVQNEYDVLYTKLNKFVLKYNELYLNMKKVNILIWDMMDLLRDGNLNEPDYLKICKECIEYNDIRFRIKNKINYISNSSLKEQKSYKINRIYIQISDDISDVYDFITPIKYFSFLYDEIVICSNNSNLMNMFNYDPTIIFEKEIIIQEYIKKYYFTDVKYNKQQIYDIFEINEESIRRII